MNSKQGLILEGLQAIKEAKKSGVAKALEPIGDMEGVKFVWKNTKNMHGWYIFSSEYKTLKSNGDTPFTIIGGVEDNRGKLICKVYYKSTSIPDETWEVSSEEEGKKQIKDKWIAYMKSHKDIFQWVTKDLVVDES
jgi:hypothetical protein